MAEGNGRGYSPLITSESEFGDCLELFGHTFHEVERVEVNNVFRAWSADVLWLTKAIEHGGDGRIDEAFTGLANDVDSDLLDGLVLDLDPHVEHLRDVVAVVCAEHRQTEREVLFTRVPDVYRDPPEEYKRF